MKITNSNNIVLSSDNAQRTIPDSDKKNYYIQVNELILKTIKRKLAVIFIGIASLFACAIIFSLINSPTIKIIQNITIILLTVTIFISAIGIGLVNNLHSTSFLFHDQSEPFIEAIKEGNENYAKEYIKIHKQLAKIATKHKIAVPAPDPILAALASPQGINGMDPQSLARYQKIHIGNPLDFNPEYQKIAATQKKVFRCCKIRAYLTLCTGIICIIVLYPLSLTKGNNETIPLLCGTALMLLASHYISSAKLVGTKSYTKLDEKYHDALQAKDIKYANEFIRTAKTRRRLYAPHRIDYDDLPQEIVTLSELKRIEMDDPTK